MDRTQTPICRQRRPNNSLQLTRLACGKIGDALPTGMHENGWADARAARRLNSRPLGGGSSDPSIGGAPWRLTLSAKRYRIAP
jgi:hypothetical protein